MHLSFLAPNAMSTKRLLTVMVVGLFVAATPAAAAGTHTTSTSDGALSVSTQLQDQLVVTVEENVDGAATVHVRPEGDAAYEGSGTYTVDGNETLRLPAPSDGTTLAVTATTDSGARVTQVVSVTTGGLFDDGTDLSVVSTSAVTAGSDDDANATANVSADADVSADATSSADAENGASVDANATVGVDTSGNASVSSRANASGDARAEAADDSNTGGLFGIHFDLGLGSQARSDAKAGGAADDQGAFSVDATVEHARATVDGWFQSLFGGHETAGTHASGSTATSGSASADA